jgi:hybrid cluster-associated redox disulfide protein
VVKIFFPSKLCASAKFFVFPACMLITNREAGMTTNEITPETILKTLFTRWPATIPVFLRHRMVCVGCTMSAFDTLEDAAFNYHLEWTPFLTELREAVQAGSEPGQPNRF